MSDRWALLRTTGKEDATHVSWLACPSQRRFSLVSQHAAARPNAPARYSELLPRLSKLDCYLVECSGRPIVRGLQFRALRLSRWAWLPVLFAAANRRYRWMLTTNPEQVQHFSGKVIADLDDPRYSTSELALLRRPNLLAYVVTDYRAARTYQALGLQKPYHIIPQGVSLDAFSPADVAAVRRLHRKEGTIVLGYVASWLLSRGDRGGDRALYNVDHLLDLWVAIRGKVPEARLWLIGQTSARVRSRCAGDPNIIVFGRVPQGKHLAYVANFDIGLYPREKDEGIRAVKIAEYMAVGVPAVAYDYQVTAQLRESGAGLLARTPTEFVDAVDRLARDGGLRRKLAGRAARAGAPLAWDRLAKQYASLLDSYFS
jgi:glycosyltransferase involved in cell wall biosynthesis